MIIAAIMAFELIPFPISILLILVFGVAFIVVLWKIRKNGRIYLILSNLSLIIGAVVLALFVYFLTLTLLHGPSSSYSPTPAPFPIPAKIVLTLLGF